METENLADFLLARIAEDEEGARIRPREWWSDRLEAECVAKRRLIDWSAPVSGHKRVPTGRPGVYDRRDVRYINEDGEDVLRYLAMPYAGHPDYRDEWRP